MITNAQLVPFPETCVKILKYHSLALALQALAVKSVIEASSVVTLFITLSVIKIAPALQRSRTVLPRIIEVQRAVPSIPVAGVIITCTVTDLIAFLVLTLCYLASHCHFWSRCDISSRATWKLKSRMWQKRPLKPVGQMQW